MVATSIDPKTSEFPSGDQSLGLFHRLMPLGFYHGLDCVS